MSACLTGALVFGDLDDPASEISHKLASLGTEVLKPGLGTHPKVFYVQPEHSLMGRIAYSTDFKEEIVEYHQHIPSPDASYWKKGR